MSTTITPNPDVQPLTIGTVLAAALGNILAGTGLGLMVAVVLALIGIDPLNVLLWSLAAAAFWSGFIMWVWFSRDEARNWRKFEAMRMDNEDMRDELDAVYDELGATKAKLQTATEDIARQQLAQKLTGKSTYVPPESIVDPVRIDAVNLIDAWARKGHTAPTQREMIDGGWTAQRYSAALSYLGTKGIIDRNTTRPTWLVDDRVGAMGLMEIA